MSHAEPFPPTVERVVATFLKLLDGEQMPFLRGLYLVGSVALDDFRPGASDVDFVVILDEPPNAAACSALAQVHSALAEAGGPCFDGFFLEAAALQQPPEDDAVVPFSLDGRFRTGEICREVTPVVWRCLARSGRTILGPPPVELGIADNEDLLRAYQTANLSSYWLSWIAECEAALAAKAPGEDCNAEALAWGVLGVSRIACTLASGRIVSKGEGGRFALASRQACWHPVIREALSAHTGRVTRVPIATVRNALAYMRFVIDEATGYQAQA